MTEPEPKIVRTRVRKLKDDDVRKIRTDIGPVVDIAKAYNVSQATIYGIRGGWRKGGVK